MKIMYVDKDKRALDLKMQAHGRPGHFMDTFYAMERLLKEEYGDVDSRLDLGDHVAASIEESAGSDKPYTALITHLPYDRTVTPGMDRSKAYAAKYGRALDVLRRIKEANPDLFILAYTGAGSTVSPAMEKVFIYQGPIDAIVLKSGSDEV
ncbi:MAG: hypothetical protein KJ709_02705, partial [Nanoarchaeota archaeon]|nr:hypothetical protein [Nanoarchaeota archaeon]